MTSARVKASFAVHEVIVLTGFSKHMLDYLSREDIFRPSAYGSPRRGRRRLYSYQDLIWLRALHTICEEKGKIRHLRQSLAKLRAEVGSLEPGQRLEKLLFVQGNELCLRTGEEAGRELRTGQMTFGFVVDLGALTSNLDISFERSSDAQSTVVLRQEIRALAENERQKTWGRIRIRREAA